MPNELKGLEELSTQLAKLGSRMGTKALRTAAFKATTPVVREMKAKAPRGTKPHRSYKGRYLAPSFLSRSIRRLSKARNGKVNVAIGVRAEAFYGVTFLDEGTITVSQRRRKVGTKGTVRRVVRKTSRSVTLVKPYTIVGRRWFKSTFRRHAPRMISEFKDLIEDAIRKTRAKQ